MSYGFARRTENLRNSEVLTFQSRGVVWDMVRLENSMRVMTVGRERVRWKDDRFQRVG